MKLLLPRPVLNEEKVFLRRSIKIFVSFTLYDVLAGRVEAVLTVFNGSYPFPRLRYLRAWPLDGDTDLCLVRGGPVVTATSEPET